MLWNDCQWYLSWLSQLHQISENISRGADLDEILIAFYFVNDTVLFPGHVTPTQGTMWNVIFVQYKIPELWCQYATMCVFVLFVLALDLEL